MLLRLRTFATSSRLLGEHKTRHLSMAIPRLTKNVLIPPLRIVFQRRCLTPQLMPKTASRWSVMKVPGVGLTVVVIGGTVLARFLLRRGLHRTECRTKSISRASLQSESSGVCEPAFNWRRFLALILPVKWLLGAAVAVSGVQLQQILLHSTVLCTM